MPLAMKFFLSMQQTGDSQVHIQLTARVSEYLSLIMTLILGFGICFQLPVLLTLLARAGLITADELKAQAPLRHPRRVRRRRRADPARPDQPDRARHSDRAALRASIFAVKLAEKQRAAPASAKPSKPASKGAGKPA